MEFFIKNLFHGKSGDAGHKHLMRFGKGNYERRFILSLNKGEKIKVRSSFELANELVNFVKESKDVKFSGKILMKEQVHGKNGRKKAGSFVYEVNEVSINEFENAYYYLLDVNSGDIVLKIKKSLPKPGKDAQKIDDKFCALDIDTKYWHKIKEAFFWDVPENAKKVRVEHTLQIKEIEMPKGVSDPIKIRELAKRKGKIIRKLNIDGKDETKEANFVI